MSNLKLKENTQRNVENLELEIIEGNLELGETYPLLGQITRFIDVEHTGVVSVELNHKIIAKLFVSDKERLEVLKRRAFETGIFVAKVTAFEPNIEVECQTVLFGKRQRFSA